MALPHALSETGVSALNRVHCLYKGRFGILPYDRAGTLPRSSHVVLIHLSFLHGGFLSLYRSVLPNCRTCCWSLPFETAKSTKDLLAGVARQLRNLDECPGTMCQWTNLSIHRRTSTTSILQDKLICQGVREKRKSPLKEGFFRTLYLTRFSAKLSRYK